jgi:mannose-1-phosphate guanylyltransferase/mannose-6-phosphate isomerase
MRVSDANLFDHLVITNAAYHFIVLEQFAGIGIEADGLPGRMRHDSSAAPPDAVMLTIAADHMVRDTVAFITAAREELSPRAAP